MVAPYRQHFSPSGPPGPPDQPDYRGKVIAIALNVLHHKNPQSVQTLKNLLTFIPDPAQANDVLKAAVIALVQSSPKSAFWLYQEADLLAPEIAVRAIIIHELTQKLQAWGYSSDDFYITPNHELAMTPTRKLAFLSRQPEPSDAAIFVLIQMLLV